MLFLSVLLFRRRNIPSPQSGDSTGTPVLVLLLFMSQRFCFSKALQHGGEGRPSCLDAKQKPSAEHTH